MREREILVIKRCITLKRLGSVDLRECGFDIDETELGRDLEFLIRYLAFVIAKTFTRR